MSSNRAAIDGVGVVSAVWQVGGAGPDLQGDKLCLGPGSMGEPVFSASQSPSRGFAAPRWLWCLALCLLGLVVVTSARADWRRQPNRTFALPLQPSGVGYEVVPILDALPSTWGVVGFASPPGETNRLFLVNKTGFILAITNLAQPDFTMFLDLTQKTFAESESGLLSMAFHPGYATNGTFFVFYTALTNQVDGPKVHDQLSRFQTDPLDPNRALPESETLFISQPDRDPAHNGSDLMFGPDGYLYVSLGDEGYANDFYENSQRIDKNFFSGILRIDVDQRPGNLPPNPHPSVNPGTYLIPADNPFVGATNFVLSAVNPTQVRTEFYAVGLRNPWRFWYDSLTGDFYCNDTGQNQREEVNLIVPGGNYGWVCREGTINWPWWIPELDKVPFIDPLVEYSHDDGNVAIVGGWSIEVAPCPSSTGPTFSTIGAARSG